MVGNLTQINRLVSGQEAMLTTVLPHTPVQECLPLKQTRAHVISGLSSILSSLGVYNSTLKLFQPIENWLYSGIYPRCWTNQNVMTKNKSGEKLKSWIEARAKKWLVFFSESELPCYSIVDVCSQHPLLATNPWFCPKLEEMLAGSLDSTKKSEQNRSLKNVFSVSQKRLCMVMLSKEQRALSVSRDLLL